jgi:hypothetical protein
MARVSPCRGRTARWPAGWQAVLDLVDLPLTSKSIACCMKRKLLRFLISRRVPSGCAGRRTETLASQRKLPSCMLPSQMPSHTTSLCSALA